MTDGRSEISSMMTICVQDCLTCLLLTKNYFVDSSNWTLVYRESLKQPKGAISFLVNSHLKQLCIKVHLCLATFDMANLEPSNAGRILVLADKHSLTEWKKVIYENLKNAFLKLFSSGRWHGLLLKRTSSGLTLFSWRS